MYSFVSRLSLNGGSVTYCSPKHPHFLKRMSPSNLSLLTSQTSSLSLQVEYSSKQLRIANYDHLKRCRVIKAAATAKNPQSHFEEDRPSVTGFLFCCLYLMTFIFNRLSRTIYEYFPFPFFVTVVHLLVGVTCCFITWSFGILKPIDTKHLRVLASGAACHALGLVFLNIYNAVDTASSIPAIKGLEPLLTAAGSWFILGYQIPLPLPLWLSLASVVIGVSMTAFTDHSYNRLGCTCDMISTITFTCRNILLKKAMRDMDSANVYAYISIIAFFLCLPAAIFIEGPKLMQYGFKDAIAKVGLAMLVRDLFLVGLFYHLYFKVALTTLQWVDPLTYAVGNTLSRLLRVRMYLMSGNAISIQTRFGIFLSICGLGLFSLIKLAFEELFNSVPNKSSGTEKATPADQPLLHGPAPWPFPNQTPH